MAQQQQPSPKLEPPPRVDIPEEPPIDPGTTHSSPRGKGFGGNSGLIQTIVIALVVVLAVIIIMSMMGGMVFVTKSDFTKNLSGIATSINEVAKKVISDNNTAGQIPSLVTTQVSSATKEINSQITSLNTKIADHSTKIADSSAKITEAQNKAGDAQIKATDAQSKASDALSKITSLTTDVNTKVTTIYSLMADYDTRLKKLEAAKPPTVDMTEVNAKLNAMALSIMDYQDKLAAYEVRIKKLEATPTPTATTTTTPTPTPTVTPVGTVTASIVPNAFSANTFMNFAPLTANTTDTQSFTIQVVNTTGKTIKNLQLAVAFGVFDITNPNVPIAYSLPSGVSATLSSGGNLSIMWDSQNTGNPKILGFMNQVNTGAFAFGNFSQAVGSQTYTQYLSLTSGNIVGTPPLLIVPTVKVIDYD